MAHLERPPIALGFSFDGVDDNVEVPYDTSLDLPTELTVLAWIKRSTTGIHHGIVSQWNILRRWWFRAHSNNKLEFYFSNDGTWDKVDYWYSSSTIGTEWTYVAVTFDNGLIRFYVNGKLDREVTSVYTSIFTGIDVTRIGYGYIEYDPFDGIIAEPSVYERVLSLAEIGDLYSIRRNIMDGCVLKLGTVGLVRGGGTQWLDESPYKNHGTVYGAKRVRCCHCNVVRDYGA